MIKTGLIGKILSKTQHTYSTSSKSIDPMDDHDYDHQPDESNIARIANKKMKMMKEKMLKLKKKALKDN